MHPMLNTAVKAARRAGAIINRASLDLDRLQVARKGPKDYVTEVDRASEEAIIEILRTAYPAHAFLGEESGAHQAPDAVDGVQPEFRWIIDPLDGTTNFIHGFPMYSVSIALVHRGQVTQAVVYDPTRNELFTASRGGGAYMNDRRIRVSGLAHYGDALVCAHVPGSAGGSAVPPRFAGLLTECASARRIGSTVLDLAYVASGRCDGFCGVNLKPWDVAAGSLLVLEAGGLVADFGGEQSWLTNGEILAAGPKVFAQMVSRLRI
ncbi:MAG: inositol monophosphatase [Candidimonas sp.]|nr:MAG: inositol monophosphatase [Candidimonas sp.]